MKDAHDIALAKLHMIYLQDGFNGMLDVNMRFGVCIFIYNYFEYLLVCLTARNIFWVLVDDSFHGFDGGGRIEEFGGGEEDNIFLCNIDGLFFCDCGKF